VSQPQTVAQTIVEEQLVKSRDRVRAYGEVFTPRHMVDRMLDLVGEELETGPDFVDKTFLEPAAGHGNFLVAILRRKLHAVEKNYPPKEWLEASLFALASIYGIELLEDNHRDAKAIMLAEFLHFHKEHGVPCGRRVLSGSPNRIRDCRLAAFGPLARQASRKIRSVQVAIYRPSNAETVRPVRGRAHRGSWDAQNRYQQAQSMVVPDCRDCSPRIVTPTPPTAPHPP
jgi:hypothetical protein